MRAVMTRGRSGGRELAPLATVPVLAMAVATGLVLLALSWRAGLTGGELATLVAGDHLSWGYVDRPPLLPLLARLADTVAGGSTVGARLPATLLSAAGVLVTALTARELGGARYAQVLAAAVYASSAFVLGTGYLLSSTTVDVFLWSLFCWLLARWARTGDDRLPIWLGVVTAVALQSDFMIAAVWVVLCVALLTVGPRQLATRSRLWAAGALAALTTAPGLIWQARNGWPRHTAWNAVEPAISAKLTFLPVLLLSAGVLAGAAGAVYGVVQLLRCAELSRYAFLGWTVIGVTATFLALDFRPYPVVGLFPVLWAAAAVELERHPLPRAWRWLPSWPVLALSALLALPGMTGLSGSLGWPHSPLTPATWLAQYGGRGPFDRQLGPRPGDAAWTALADEVAGRYLALPAAARANVVIVTQSYWAAAALDRFGEARGLPKVYSAQAGYWYFGAPPEDTDTVLYVGDPAAIRPYFDELRDLGTVAAGPPGAGVVPGGTALWLVGGRHEPWSRLWPLLRAS
jgi:4-amino-4-deoxy-L-arabinose transferase-like glycosyltransferase